LVEVGQGSGAALQDEIEIEGSAGIDLERFEGQIFQFDIESTLFQVEGGVEDGAEIQEFAGLVVLVFEDEDVWFQGVIFDVINFFSGFLGEGVGTGVEGKGKEVGDEGQGEGRVVHIDVFLEGDGSGEGEGAFFTDGSVGILQFFGGGGMKFA